LALCSSLALAAATEACGSCGKPDAAGGSDAAAGLPDASANGGRAVAEALPRCRPDPHELTIPGEDVVAGDAVVAGGSLYVGAVRLAGGKRVASVVRASLDLASVTAIDLGPAFGEDPPPSPRVHAGAVFVAFYTRRDADAGAHESLEGGTGGMSHATRELRVARLEDKGLGKVSGTASQQADESTAFDVAWPLARPAGAEDAPLVAWDEDAPIPDKKFLPDRGRVKVQRLTADPDAGKPVVASPWTSDADSPQLLARPAVEGGGFWLAWIARRSEVEDAGEAPEGPGESPSYRWIEIAPLDAKGEVAGAVRRVSPERGRVVAFELAPGARGGAGGKGGGGGGAGGGGAGDAPELVVLVQDEAAPREGGGSRIVRYAVGGPSREGGKIAGVAAADLVDGGVGRALAATFPLAEDGGSRWLAWSDSADRAHLLPLGAALSATAPPSLEPSLDGARVLATVPRDGRAGGAGPPVFFALAASGSGTALRAVIRRLTCAAP
jgi:hypothetical protein